MPKTAGECDTAEGHLRTLLAERGQGKTLCPSEVARRLAGDGGDWRDWMADVHAAVDRLVANEEVVLSWQGQRMPRRAGPYRIAPRP